ncbi:MAG: Holliday junction resolvase RuvX [Clostridia bacterium]|jgi:putative Holliday junction resolvase|nr:Holliday junction resolvase RuvX [Clostridia bacterium]
MGLDIGDRRIGVALSDECLLTSQPLGVVHRSNLAEELQAIKNLVDHHDVSTVVVGLPRNMNGTLGPQAEKVLAYVDELARFLPIRVVTWDERLTTMQVERLLISADVRRKRRKEVVDKLAASLILEGYMAFEKRDAPLDDGPGYT